MRFGQRWRHSSLVWRRFLFFFELPPQFRRGFKRRVTKLLLISPCARSGAGKTVLRLQRMIGKCHQRWALLFRGSGAAGVIAICVSSLALAGSPQLHEHMQHGARLVHSCAITLSKASKCVKGMENRAKPLVGRVPTVVPVGLLLTPSPTWVPKLFLEACRCEHGPPAPFLGAFP